jgi:hypothetical protein
VPFYKKFIEYAHVAMNDQRLIVERKLPKARCYFSARKLACILSTVRDLTNRGAGIRAQNLKIVPVARPKDAFCSAQGVPNFTRSGTIF